MLNSKNLLLILRGITLLFFIYKVVRYFVGEKLDFYFTSIFYAGLLLWATLYPKPAGWYFLISYSSFSSFLALFYKYPNRVSYLVPIIYFSSIFIVYLAKDEFFRYKTKFDFEQKVLLVLLWLWILAFPVVDYGPLFRILLKRVLPLN